MKESIFIPGNTPSSKNSKVWTGKFLVSSKTTRDYAKNHSDDYWINKVKFKKIFSGIASPYFVGMYFVRDSKRRFDYINICQVVADLMVMNGLIEDDSAEYFVPVFLGYKVDKQHPGVYITRVDSIVTPDIFSGAVVGDSDDK
jgi:hypothetical protein